MTRFYRRWAGIIHKIVMKFYRFVGADSLLIAVDIGYNS